MLDPNCRPAVIPDRAAYLARLGAVLARADVVKVSRDDLAYLDAGCRAGRGGPRPHPTRPGGRAR